MDVSRLSERVTAIVEGSKASVDMDVNIPTTKTLYVRQQEEVNKTTDEEARSKCKF